MVDGEKITIAPDSPRASRVVFICDPSAEADRLQASLRGRGYPVVDVPLALLASRIRYEQPDLVVLDADAPNAAELTTDIVNAATGRVRVILLGDTSGQAEALAAKFPAHALAFARPVDVENATHTITSLLGPPVQTGPRSRIPRPPGLVAATRRPVRVDSLASLPPTPEPHQQHSEFAPSLFPSLPPLPSEKPPGARSRPAPSSRQSAERTGGLSAETRAILEQGRRKVRSSEAEAPRPYRLGSSSDAEIPESSPLLDLLEASLDGEDEPTTKVGGPLAHVSPSTPPFGYRAKSGPPTQAEVPSTVAEPRGSHDTRTSDHVGEERSGADEPTNPGGRGRPGADIAEPSAMEADSLDEPSPLLDEVGHDSDDDDDAPPSSLGPVLVGFGVRPPHHKADAHSNSRPEPPLTVPPPRARSDHRPRTLGREPPLRTLARAIRERSSGALVQQGPQGLRRILLAEGDLLAVPSTCQVDALAYFLEAGGHLKRETALRFRSQVGAPRTAAAALVAEGLLSHDELLPVLGAHAEWVLSNILRSEEALRVEGSPPGRSPDEPSVFGGRAGAHVFLDAFRRTVDLAQAFSWLGEGALGLAPGPETSLIAEVKLAQDSPQIDRIWTGHDLADLAARKPKDLVLLAGLVELGILTAGSIEASEEVSPLLSGSHTSGPTRVNGAFEERLDARLRLVKAGSYFSLLGLDEHATFYEIARAHQSISDEFALERIPPHQTARAGDVKLVLRLAEEAYRVLSDDARRTRYRRALARQNPR